ncbi:MAG: GDSL-type esterase/lipase family protein [Pseudomonadota bacterium]
MIYSKRQTPEQIDSSRTSEPSVSWLRRLALVFLVIGLIGLVGYYVSYHDRTTVAISELTPDADGFLVGDFSKPWPFKFNKSASDQVIVQLPDGETLQQFLNPRALGVGGVSNGFIVDRPNILIQLDPSIRSSPDVVLSVTVPVQTRQSLYQVALAIPFVLLVISSRSHIARVLRAIWWRPLAASSCFIGLAIVGFLSLSVVEGAAVWIALLALVVGPLVALATLMRVEASVVGRRLRLWEIPLTLGLMLGAVLGSCALIEAYLNWNHVSFDHQAKTAASLDADWFQLPKEVVELAEARDQVLTMPDAWQHREETIEGASWAYTWHEALHVHDQWGFRRLNGPFAPKDSETLRILVVGDSLTYGMGIEQDWTFSSLLQRSLETDHRLEIVNLGNPGYQSEDILWVLREFVPQLKPDLVIYAMSLNDFLPTDQGQYKNYSFPMPEHWKQYLLDRTYLSRLVNDGYKSLLLELNLRQDFYDDILVGEQNYQERFARDVAAMNAPVLEYGLPPIIGIVFHQYPGGDSRGWDLIEIAERAMGDAGFDLISVMSWRERFKDSNFRVSRWEGHPNELANSVLAEHLYEELLEHRAMQAFRRDATGSEPGR